MKYIDAEKLIAEIERLDEKYRLIRVGKNIQQAKEADLVIHVLLGLSNFITSLQQEQPDVELGEITPSFAENMICEFGVQSIEDMDSEILAEFARHFWNKGFNARKK